MLTGNALCAVQWSNYILDIAVVALFLVMAIICGSRGFFSCILGIISTVAALLAAIFLAKLVVDATGGLFGLQGVFAKKFSGTFSKLGGFDVDVSGADVETALKTSSVPAVLARLVLKIVGKQEGVAAGTTLGQLVGQATASLATTLIAGLIIFILVKILVGLLKRVLNNAADNVGSLGWVNSLLGALYGVLCALLLVSALLAVLAVIPINALSNYLSKTLFVGALYAHNPLVYILSWFL